MQKSLAYKMRLPTGSAQMNLNLKARLTQKLLLLLLKFISNSSILILAIPSGVEADFVNASLSITQRWAIHV